jgi:peptidoglycan-associated lipoprotein
MKKILIGFSLAILLAACASKEAAKTAPVESRTPEPTAKVDTTPKTQTTTGTEVTGSANDAMLKDPNNILSKRIIYFDLDKDSVKPEYAALIQAHATFLANSKKRKIRLEGHADERGSREYNMALGQRRGDAVRRAASALGVNNDRMETVSFGEDKPKATGHDEAAWAQNRRVEIVYDGE